MIHSRHALLPVLVLLAGCGQSRAPHTEPEPATPMERLDRALARASTFLVAQQAPDGAWRSDFYGPLKDGPSLTPLVLQTLHELPSSADVQAACTRGAAYLAGLARPDGTIDEGPHGLSYPVYTAAGAVVVLSDPAHAAHRAARDAWLRYLRQRQLTEALGWQPTDKPYGGWGYCPRLPHKPSAGEPVPPLLESNLSATVFALDALHAAGVPANDPAYAAALVFVKRCQNYADDAQARDAAFDDGGFFFIYDDAARNKAGAAGKDRLGQQRFTSYGSATADGLRGLRACGLTPEDARVTAARAWLEANFDAAAHPGKYVASRQADRAAVYFYYCRSLTRALRPAPPGEGRWPRALADELLKRQRDDGSWINDAMAQRENDPLIATSEAAAALAGCRSELAGTRG